jgi:hypothetical protein
LTGFTDGTSDFTAAAADGQEVTWTLPTDWAQNTLNSVQAFYVRARISAGSYSTNPVYDQGFLVSGDGDFLVDQDISAVSAAILDVPITLDSSDKPIQSVSLLAQALLDGARLAPSGTVDFTLLEVVGLQPPHIVDTGDSGTLTVGAPALVIDVSAVAAAALGAGQYVVRITATSGLPATTDTVRLYAKAV